MTQSPTVFSYKRKVCFVITSKIHYSRNKLVLHALKKHPDIELQIVLGGAALLERFGVVEPELVADGFSVNARFHMTLEGTSPMSMAKSAGIGLMEIPTIFENLKPDIVLVRGDRYEVLSVAMAAAYMNIPVAHIEGGDVTGSIDESVRHAITKLAHIHFPTNNESAARIIRMGEKKDYVHVVGSPEIQVVAESNFNVSEAFVNNLGVGDVVQLNKQFIIVMQHPVTTEAVEAGVQVQETLEAINDLGIPAIWFWPNVDAGSDAISKRIRVFREQQQPAHIRFLRYLPSDQFYGLLKASACLVGNSSSGFKEAAFLGVPVVNIGTRQNNRYGEHSALHIMNVEYERAEIRAAVERQLAHGAYAPDPFLYRERTAETIVHILATCSLYTQKSFSG